MVSLKYQNSNGDKHAYEVLSSIPHICEVRNRKMIIPVGGTDHIKLCLKGPSSELIAEVKLLIRGFNTKEVEEILQFDVEVSNNAK